VAAIHRGEKINLERNPILVERGLGNGRRVIVSLIRAEKKNTMLMGTHQEKRVRADTVGRVPGAIV